MTFVFRPAKAEFLNSIHQVIKKGLALKGCGRRVTLSECFAVVIGFDDRINPGQHFGSADTVIGLELAQIAQ